MENWIGLVSELGFPMAITFFCLLKLDRSLSELKEEIKKLTDEIRKTGRL